MISVQEAQSIILGQAESLGEEEVKLTQSRNRILAEDILSDRDYPPFNRATMDGFAVKSEDLQSGKYGRFRIIEEIFAGNTGKKKIANGETVKIMTGAPVPEGTDAVIRVEDATLEGSQVSFKVKDIKQWQNIAPQGEDVRNGEIMARRGKSCTPPIISLLAVVGKSMVLVKRVPKVAVISTGNEVVPIDKTVLPHQIRDSNSWALKAFLEDYRIPVAYSRLVGDDQSSLRAALAEVMGFDLIIFSGGVSMGEADFVPKILSDLRVKKLLHKIKIKPGKPLWFGTQPAGGVVFGLPGNPMSCQVGYKLFIEPYLRECFGMSPVRPQKLPLKFERKKRVSFDEYFPCKYTTRESTVLKTVPFKGSGDILSTVNSHGIALHPALSDDLAANSLVDFLPWQA